MSTEPQSVPSREEPARARVPLDAPADDRASGARGGLGHAGGGRGDEPGVPPRGRGDPGVRTGDLDLAALARPRPFSRAPGRAVVCARAVSGLAGSVEQLHAGLPGYRLRMPAEVHPISAGLKGGIVGGIVMTLPALAHGLLTGHGIWYPVNLLAGMVLPCIGSLSTRSWNSFDRRCSYWPSSSTPSIRSFSA